MIETFTTAFGKKIRYEPLANRIGKIAQDPAGLQEAMGRQSETFQADHGVAAPIGKPVIASDYRAHVVARGIGPGRVRHSSGGCHDELIGGEHEFGAYSVPSFGIGGIDQSLSPLTLRFPCLRGPQSSYHFPRLGGGYHRNLVAGGAIDKKRTRSPQISDRHISTGFL